MTNKGSDIDGKPMPDKSSKFLTRLLDSIPKTKLHFSGPSPPEIFVGRIGYPNINSGILAPMEFDSKHGDFNSAEDWSKANLSIANVLRLRGQLIYGRSNFNIREENKTKAVTQELAMTHKATSTEFFLKKKPVIQVKASSIFKPMTNPAPIKKVLLEENTKVIKKVDYLVNDDASKATEALKELYHSQIKTDHLQKLLSAGLLGLKKARKMVPTRWSITAVDDTVSKQLLEKIKYYSEINEITLLSGNYIGNYVEILILPGMFSFEAIEAWDSGSTYFEDAHNTTFSHDYEGFNGRKTYASNVTGGYYAMLLPVAEYLEKIRKQATILVFRRITPEYYAPLGVGVVREATRRATRNDPQTFETIDTALKNMVTRIGFNIETIKEKSWILNEYGKQKNLKQWF